MLLMSDYGHRELDTGDAQPAASSLPRARLGPPQLSTPSLRSLA